jgi:hypothetical protein
MGIRIQKMFTKALAKGGVEMIAKLAIKTCITIRTAGFVEDSPANLAKVTKVLDALLAELEAGQSSAAAMPPRPMEQEAHSDAGSEGHNQLSQYYEFAKNTGGLSLVAKLAMKTCITSKTARTLPDTPENLRKVRTALTELLPGVTIS